MNRTIKVKLKDCFKGLKMLKIGGKFKRNKLFSKPARFEIRWYPGNKNYSGTKYRGGSFQYMPPLMVRKAEWRR
jgi:hypothetical protein